MMWYTLHSLHYVLQVRGTQWEWVKGRILSSKVQTLPNLWHTCPRPSQKGKTHGTARGRRRREQHLGHSPSHQGFPQQECVPLGINCKQCLQQRDPKLNSCFLYCLPAAFHLVLVNAGANVALHGWAGGNAGVAWCSAGCLAPRKWHWSALAKACQ